MAPTSDKPQVMIWGLPVGKLLDRGTSFCCLVVVSFVVWKYNLEPSARERKLLIDATISATESVAANSEQVAEAVIAMNKKIDQILVNTSTGGGR